MAGIAKIRKLHDDRDFIIFDEIRLLKGQSLKIKDFRGFTVAEFMDNGELKLKGKRVKT